jgi:hypothetical protein
MRPDGSFEILILAIKHPYPLQTFKEEKIEVYIFMYKLSYL